MEELAPGDVVRHYRNKKDYTILGQVWNTQTDAWVILYQAEYDDPELGLEPRFVRPVTEFFELVENEEGQLVPRFSIVKKGVETL